MKPMASVLMLLPLLAGCTYGPVVDRSGFESAALAADGHTVVVAYRILRYRPATGLAAWPDGGVPSYVEDRAVVAAAPVGGGAPRILLRVENSGVPGTTHVALRRAQTDPAHVLVGLRTQGSTRTTPRTRWSRLAIADGQMLPYPDLTAELTARGRTLGSPEVGAEQVLSPQGDLLIGARAGDQDELWLRRAGGDYQRLDAITHFYGVAGDELYYWSGDEAVVRNWRTLGKRVIARYDPQLRQTTRLIRDDPVVKALEGPTPPASSILVPADGSAVLLESRAPDGQSRARPLAIDPAILRR